MQRFNRLIFVTPLVVLVLMFGAVSLSMAQEEKKDNSGTNPVNFTYDFRFYTEMAQIPDDGGSMITNTVEFRAPLGRDIANLTGKQEGLFNDMGNRFSLRFRGRYQNLSVTDPSASPFGASSVSGIGDFDARLLGIAYTSNWVIIAPGLEAFFNTASNPALGSGKVSLGPQVFFAFPGLLGKGSLFAPGYQYVFSVAGDDNRDDISRSQIDIYGVWGLAGGKNWLILDPQIVLDHKNSREFLTVEAEWGFIIYYQAGISGYLRPGVGFGEDKPYSWNLEAGLKFVWR